MAFPISILPPLRGVFLNQLCLQLCIEPGEGHRYFDMLRNGKTIVRKGGKHLQNAPEEINWDYDKCCLFRETSSRSTPTCHFRVPVVNICLGEHEVEQLASFVAYKMQFETEMPPHGTLAGLGIIMKYLVSFNALVVAYWNACAVNETYARASSKTKQLEKQHHLQGDSGF